MTPAQFQAIEGIIDAVDALPESDRKQYIARACGANTELLAKVEALLAARESAEQFLERPALEGGIEITEGLHHDAKEQFAREELFVGQTLGKFAIKRVVGRGGMGIVYEAQQENPRRRVALKIVKSESLTRDIARRFKYEAQILATLDHESIGKIYEAGVYNGQPYFAMEYIQDAQTILAYANQNKLDMRQRLTLFARVCDAVAHGHVKGVIHRDLKPGNILINSSGTPKVIDFGVAKTTNADILVATQQTEIGQLIGTLQYMSPEQYRGDPVAIDTRSDVYSLGVVLFELLCGRTPHDLTYIPIAKAAQIVEFERPIRPSTVNHALRGDIETIVLKAIEKSASDRYQSASELGEDIRAHLENKPIIARPASRLTSLLLFVKRNKVGAAFGAGAVGILVIALAVTLAALLRENEERRTKKKIVNNVLRRVQEDFISTSPIGSSYFLFEELETSEQNQHRGTLIMLKRTKGPSEPGTIVFVDGRGEEVQSIESVPATEIPTWARSKTISNDPTAQLLVQGALLAEMISEQPGRELVVNFAQPGGRQSLLRIYDLDLNVLRNLWVAGGFGHLIWNSEFELLLVAIRCGKLTCVDPRLAPYVSGGCPLGQEGFEAIIAVRPETMNGVLFPEYQVAPAAHVEWALAYEPIETRTRNRSWSARIDGFVAPKGNRSEVVCDVNLVCKNLGVVTSRLDGEFRLRIPLSNTGWPADAPRLRLDDYPPHMNRVPLADDFVRLDLNSIARVFPAATDAIDATITEQEAIRKFRESNSFSPLDEETGVRAIKAMFSNWRWLGFRPSNVLSMGDKANEQDLRNALYWAELVSDLHAQDCPNPSTCPALWWARDNLGIIQLKLGLFEDARNTLLECANRDGNTGDDLTKYRAMDFARLSMACASLGEAAEAIEFLKRAQENFAAAKPDETLSAVLVEAEQVVSLCDYNSNENSRE